VARAAVLFAERLLENVHVASSRLLSGSAADAASDIAALPSPDVLHTIRDEADAILRRHVMPFWAAHAWDEPHGGFILELGPRGVRLGPTTKHLVPQARLVWSFAAAHRHGLREHGYLDLAARGARFLADRMWDDRHGGFYGAVARDASPLRLEKETYGQAFAIYALAEYALASGDTWARERAADAFDVLIRHADDGAWGYRERFDAAWRPLATPDGHGKTVNVHLHLIEALTTLLILTGHPRHADRLRAVLRLVLDRGVDHRDGFSINDRLSREWQWQPSWRHPIGVSYGHAVELAWLSKQALDALGDPDDEVRPVALGLIDHALRYGFDHGRGGIATFGPPVGRIRHASYLPRAWRTTRWWEQCEMLVGLLVAHQWNGAPKYLAAFEKQFAWVRPPGFGQPDAAFDPSVWGSHDWKDPYHGVRALIEVSRRLSL
jgi:mannose/cellobiose epimerase-like protein (N-acyl-D-glucosamine 2-epimerase family)